MNDPVMIHVSFLDQSGEVLFESEMSPEQLPVSFEAHTTFHIDDADWDVIDAQPSFSSDFAATRELRITVRRIVLVHVTVSDNSGTVLVSEDVPLDHLPDFTTSTTFQLGSDTWHVTNVQPPLRAEVAQTRQLQVTVAKIQKIDPSKLRYSLATISNDFPTVHSESIQEYAEVLELAEDDWRQIDILPRTVLPEVDSNLTAIAAIHRNNDTGYGFSDIHVRQGLDHPFHDNPLTMADLMACLPEAQQLAGVRITYPATAMVDQGFAIRLPSQLIVYGNVVDGLIDHLAINDPNSQTALAELDSLLSHYELIVVDWLRMAVYHR